MKAKFYTFALMTSIALGASAAELAPVKLADGIKVKGIEKSAVLNKNFEPNKKEVKSPATSAVLDGDFNVTYFDYVSAAQQAKVYQFAGEALFEENGEEVMISFPFAIEGSALQVEVPAKVSGDRIIFTDGTPVKFNDWEFEIWALAPNSNNQLDFVDEVSAVYNGSGFILQDQMIAVASDEDGWLFGAFSPIFQKTNTPEKDLTLGWKSLGKANFQDAWMMSNFAGGEQSNPDYWYEVELQQNEADENIYRLVNPYGEGVFPFAEYNEFADRIGFIQFNMADPDHVFFYPVPANFNNYEIGIYQYYTMDIVGMFYFREGADLNSVVEYLESESFPFCTFKDNVVTIPTVNIKGEITNAACFGIDDMPYAGYTWMTQNGEALNMEGKIFFPGDNGVESIVDNSNAPVKYFNLQGVEVANPEKGQLLIKKQGTKAEKLIVR